MSQRQCTRLHRLILIYSFVCLLVIVGCAPKDSNGSGLNDHTESETADQVEHEETDEQADQNIKTNLVYPSPPLPPVVDPVLEQIQTLTLDEKIGQLLIVGIEGTEVHEQVEMLVAKYHVGGVILFGRNIEDTDQLGEFINDIKQLNLGHAAPLFIAVDEEGGRVSRMPNELIPIPTNRAIGRVDDEMYSYAVGEGLARMVKALGFNLNFAPVLDIDSNPANPVIGDRSFGPSADLVSRLGIATMKGMQDGKVIAGVKHFPGHGDTAVDSHTGLPVVDKTLEDLMQFELIPFQGAIEHGADLVMSSHILFPQIDAKYPASLSSVFLTELLRGEMKYEGVIVTDDLTMGAISENYSLSDAAVQAVLAGTDIVLVCHGFEAEIAVFEAMKQAVESGMILEERIDESVYRVLRLKQKYNLSDEPVASVNVDEINRDLTEILTRWGLR